jgi:hypothetical protein
MRWRRSKPTLQSILVEAIERGKADGSIRPDAGPSALLGLTLWGLMHGVLQLTQHKSGSLESAGVSQVELIEQGFVFAARAIASSSALRS